ncbi:ArsC family reductase [Marinimicrobium sp. C2-29]|uniref:ArsC family reductase n=1 Tax=Marinimicrobium sp. C2-29 TaxID=3139825 RepID=UPI003138F964
MGNITLYGIKNCDTVKKARRWLDDNAIAYRFHDVRTDGISRAQVEQWLDELGLALVNKRSTSWKALDETTRAGLTSDKAADLVLEQPTLIKRPLLDIGESRHLGFKPADYQHLFNL